MIRIVKMLLILLWDFIKNPKKFIAVWRYAKLQTRNLDVSNVKNFKEAEELGKKKVEQIISLRK